MKIIPEVIDQGIPVWLAGFLRSLRNICLRRFYGIPNRMQKVVTFQDLVDLGITPKKEALTQAEKNDG